MGFRVTCAKKKQEKTSLVVLGNKCHETSNGKTSNW